MHGIEDAISAVEQVLDDFYKITLSNPFKAAGERAEYFKICAEPKAAGGKTFYQVSNFYETKVKHENFRTAGQLAERLRAVMPLYRQADISSAGGNIKLLLNANGTCKIIRAGNSAARQIKGHNEEKNHIIKDGEPTDWLCRLDIMNAEGKVFAQKQKKFKQINRFLEMVRDVSGHIPNGAYIVDAGCGKSYLTFALYHYLNIIEKKNVTIAGLDIKKDVVEMCQGYADAFGFGKLRFYAQSIETFEPEGGKADMVVTLHACDTATDYALFNAVKWNAQTILSVPCCQHELNNQIRNGAMKSMLKHGILRERFAALLTDGLRSSLLEVCGYRCAVMEFIDMEHTPKNIMLRAVKKTGGGYDADALGEYLKAAEMFGVKPTLYGLLEGRFYGGDK